VERSVFFNVPSMETADLSAYNLLEPETE
jgi:hypothetical protein